MPKNKKKASYISDNKISLFFPQLAGPGYLPLPIENPCCSPTDLETYTGNV